MKEQTKAFWKQVKQDEEIVKTWPIWMRRIVITAETASTGKFIDRGAK